MLLLDKNCHIIILTKKEPFLLIFSWTNPSGASHTAFASSAFCSAVSSRFIENPWPICCARIGAIILVQTPPTIEAVSWNLVLLCNFCSYLFTWNRHSDTKYNHIFEIEFLDLVISEYHTSKNPAAIDDHVNMKLFLPSIFIL